MTPQTSHSAARLFVLQTAHGGVLVMDRATGAIHHGDIVPGQHDAVLACIPADRPTACLLLAPTGACPTIGGVPNAASFLAVGAVPQEDGRIALRHPVRRTLACAIPAGEPGVPGAIDFDRTDIGPWELFTPIEATDIPDVLRELAAALTLVLLATTLAAGALQVMASAEPTPDLLAMLTLMDAIQTDLFARTLRTDAAAAQAFAALAPNDIWARDALPALGRVALFAPAECFERSIGPAIDHLAQDGFDGRYVSFGQLCNAYARRDHVPRKQMCVLATARNEGLYLLEWLAYHQALGVQDFFLYTNDNEDGSDALLHALVQARVIHWIRNTTSPGVSPQYKAYGHAFQILPELVDYQWVAVIDLDEFVVLDTERYPTLPALTATREADPADAVTLSWLMYGPDGKIHHGDQPVTERFTRREPQPHVNIKSICRPARFVHSQAHYPIWDDRLPVTLRTASGGPHHQVRAGDGTAFHPAPSDQHAWVAHYFSKSAEEYILRRSFSRADGGLTVAAGPQFFSHAAAELFVRILDDGSFIEDTRPGACVPDLQDRVQALRALPGVDEAMRTIEALYRERVEKLPGLLAEDTRFQADGTPERWFADVLTGQPAL